MYDKNLKVCHGGNYSILLQSEYILLRNSWRRRSTQRIPLRDIRSVVVERKSVVPFAAITILALIGTTALKYNALWFLLDLSSDNKFSAAAFIAILIFAAPTLSRILFVNVTISTSTDSWRVRFVPAPDGKRLVKELQEFSRSWT